MTHCLSTVVTEVLRLSLGAGDAGRVILIKLSPVHGENDRARGAENYTVTVFMAWLALPWSGGVTLIDARGYPLEMTMARFALWMVKGLAGVSYGVQIDIEKAQTLAVHWTQDRAQKSAQKMAALDVEKIEGEALAKQTSVSTWLASGRKTAVLNAALRMGEGVACLTAARLLAP
jgi:hypothetical protein